jgi:hypothetical protein
MADNAPNKGWFGRARLPVALAYIVPADRSRMLLIAAATGLFGLAVLATNFWLQDASLVSSGPLSSGHATLEANCASCHVSFESVVNEKCSVCHNRSDTHVASYAFAAHYVYVSDDQTRAFGRDGEVPCAACHVEHQGRESMLTRVGDDRCISCHAYAPFESGHPQFAVLDEPDNDAIPFTHIKHVERVLDENDSGDTEAACAWCHVTTADELGFEPVRFASACASCHLGAEVTSAELEVMPASGLTRRAGNGVALQLGAETLDTIRRRQGPGERWALETNPGQFDAGGGVVTKFGVSHKDPWITHNLRNLRRLLYPSQGLADLLVATADVSNRDKAVLYAEALATLQEYARGLRGRSEDWILDELAEIEPMMAELEQQIAAPTRSLSVAKFRLDRTRNSALTDDQVSEINDFAELVAEPCVVCHQIQDATILRPAPDQRILRRSVFNHRAHVIQRGCLDCHTEIPFLDLLDAGEPIPREVDSAAIQNIPNIEVCQACHTEEKASTQCQTCHVFHPGSDPRSALVRSGR